MKPRALICIVAAAILCGAPSAAYADAPPPSSAEGAKGDALTDVARDLYDQGLAAYRRNEFEKAYAAFLGAWRLKKHWQIAVNLGASASKLGKHREAAEALHYYLREAPKDDVPATRKEAEDTLASATAHLTVLRLTIDESGADVRVDGAIAGTSPLGDPLFLDPGTHTIEVKKDGFDTATEKIDAEAGATEARSVSLKSSGGASESKSVVPLIALSGAAVVAAGIGIGLMAAWSDRRAQVQQVSEDIRAKGHSCVAGAGNFDPRCAALESDARGAVPLSRAGVGMLIGAGALAAGAAVYWFWPRASSSTTGVRVVPVASSEGGGAWVVGSF